MRFLDRKKITCLVYNLEVTLRLQILEKTRNESQGWLLALSLQYRILVNGISREIRGKTKFRKDDPI